MRDSGSNRCCSLLQPLSTRNMRSGAQAKCICQAAVTPPARHLKQPSAGSLSQVLPLPQADVHICGQTTQRGPLVSPRVPHAKFICWVGARAGRVGAAINR